jgi:hypothetical protein
MPKLYLLVVSFLILPTASTAVGQVDSATVSTLPLFASRETLEFVLESDFSALRGDRDQEEEERPGAIELHAPDGSVTRLEIEVRTRGNFRLQRRVCDFPPLRLDIRTRTARGTVFEGQDKLKLVTHCRPRDDYEQYVLKEYVAYRIYELFTDRSFRARPARITYVEADEERDPIVRYAFLIEDEDYMAARNGARMVEREGVHQYETDDEQTTVLEMFQYFIGNTDWSFSSAHNIKLMERPGEPFLIPVPYDFDFSGLVEARYAAPPPELGTQRVRDRVFIGPCRTRYDIDRVLVLFGTRRAEIERVMQGIEGLSERSLGRTMDYVMTFYDCAESERCVRREIIRGCP